MGADQRIHMTSAWHLLEILEKMIALLLETGGAYGVISIDEQNFIQVMALDDGSLRLESTASSMLVKAGLGFDEIVDGHEHIAATRVGAHQVDCVEVAAKLLTLVAVEVHGLTFPTDLEFELDVIDQLAAEHSPT